MKLENTITEEVQLLAPLTIDGESFNKIVIRETKGFDEEYLSQPKFEKTPYLIVPELVSRCIVEVPGAKRLPTLREVRELPVAQVDDLAARVNKLSTGGDLEVDSQCDSCGVKDKTELNLEETFITDGDFANKKIEFKRPVSVNNEEFSFAMVRPLLAVDQDILGNAKLNTAEFMSAALTKVVVTLGDSYKPKKEEITGLPTFARKQLKDSIQDFPKYDIVVKRPCKKCNSGDQIGMVNIIGFLSD